MLKSSLSIIFGAVCLIAGCNTAVSKKKDIGDENKNEIKKNKIMDNYSWFYQKYYNEDIRKFGFYKVLGIRPDIDFKWKKLNVDYMVKEKNIAISPAFEDALEFSEGLAAVKKNGLWGLINEQNEWVVQPSFKAIGEHYSTGSGIAFKEELAPACKNNHWGFINKTGEFVIHPIFNEAKCFSEKIATVKYPERNTWSLINEDGELIRHTNFQLIHPFFEGKAAALPPNSGWVFINKNGDIIIEYKGSGLMGKKGFETAYSFSDGMALVRPENQYYGYIDTSGKMAIKDIFVEALGFSHGLAAAKKDESWGFVNKNGEWIVEPIYNFVNSFIIFPDDTIRAKVNHGDSTYFIINPYKN